MKEIGRKISGEYRMEAAVKDIKTSGKTVVAIVGKTQKHMINQTKNMTRFTKKKKFKIKFKEFRKKVWFHNMKYRKFYRLINTKMKEHSGIKHIAQMRYILRLFAVNQNTIFINTIDYAKMLMKIQVTREELEGGKFDIVPDFLCTRKIPHLMYGYCEKTCQRNFNNYETE
jgi:hypothetical protein